MFLHCSSLVINLDGMPKDVVEIQVQGVLPAANGFAVFLGNKSKTFIIYVDPSVGTAITLFLQGTHKERPLTHDLIGSIFSGIGVTVERVIINALKGSTYYARLILQMHNELGTKIIEIDARPSDCIALAVQQKAKIYCATDVFAVVEDSSEVLEKINDQGGSLEVDDTEAEPNPDEEDDDEAK